MMLAPAVAFGGDSIMHSSITTTSIHPCFALPHPLPTMDSVCSDSSPNFLDHVHCSVCYRSFVTSSNEAFAFDEAQNGASIAFWMAEVSQCLVLHKPKHHERLTVYFSPWSPWRIIVATIIDQCEHVLCQRELDGKS